MKGSNKRRYLTEGELDKLIKSARKGRHGQRDATLVLLMARHGLRVTEAVDCRWDQIDFAKGHLHVKRLKGGLDSVHPIQGDEFGERCGNSSAIRNQSRPSCSLLSGTGQ